MKRKNVDATSFFKRYNGKRHAILDKMREASETGSRKFNTLYREEEKFLKTFGIKYNPRKNRWEFVGMGDEAAWRIAQRFGLIGLEQMAVARTGYRPDKMLRTAKKG